MSCCHIDSGCPSSFLFHIYVTFFCILCVTFQAYQTHIESEVHKYAVAKKAAVKMGLDIEGKLEVESVQTKDMAASFVKVNINLCG